MEKSDDTNLTRAYQMISDISTKSSFIPIHFPVSYTNGLSEALTASSKILKIPLEGALPYFSKTKNPNFERDTIDANNINFEDFQLRLSNFLLENIHKQGNHSESVQEFLSKSYEKRAGKGIEIQSGSEEEKNESNSASRERSESGSNSGERSESDPEMQNRRKSGSKEKRKSKNQLEKKHTKFGIEEKGKLKLDLDEKNKKLAPEEMDKSRSRSGSERKDKPGSDSEENKQNFDLEEKNESNSDSEEKNEESGSLFLSELLNQKPKREAKTKPEIKKKEPKKAEITKIDIVKEIEKIAEKEKQYKDFLHKWSGDCLEKYRFEIEEIFKKFQKNGVIKQEKLPELSKNVLEILNLYVSEEDIKELSGLIQDFYCTKEKKNLKISLEGFIQGISVWGEKYNSTRVSFKGKLNKTIVKISELQNETSGFGNISDVLIELQINLRKIKENIQGCRGSFQAVVKKNIEEIFSFYAKAQKTQGLEDTFEGLESSNASWNLGKFLKFCQDFSLVSLKPELKVTKEHLTNVFKKTALNTRIMDLNNFIVALDRIAEAYYNPAYDKENQTSFANKTLEEKRDLLFKKMKLNIVNSYLSIVKGFNKSYIPEDLVKVKDQKKKVYNYQLPESISKQIENWKNKEFVIHNVSKIKDMKIVVNKQKKQRKSSEDFQSRVGYASKLKLKNQVNQFTPTNRLKKLDLSEVADDVVDESEEAQDKVEPEVPVTNRIITIQDLSRMDYNDFDENEFRDLVNDDQDEYFNKIYKIEPKLKAILKMHEDKLARGQKVIEKSKPGYLDKKVYK